MIDELVEAGLADLLGLVQVLTRYLLLGGAGTLRLLRVAEASLLEVI